MREQRGKREAFAGPVERYREVEVTGLNEAGAEVHGQGSGWPAAYPPARARGEEDAAQAKALVDLRAWFEEGAAIAKSVIKRRDQSIVIGLANKRK